MTNELPTVHERPPSADDGSAGVAAAARVALERSGSWVGIAAGAAPTVAFVAATAISGLGWAFVAVAVATPVAFGMRIARRLTLAAVTIVAARRAVPSSTYAG